MAEETEKKEVQEEPQIAKTEGVIDLEEVTSEGKTEPVKEETPEQKMLREENDKALVQLKEMFGLNREQIQQCMDLEVFISNPENKILTLMDGMKKYEEGGLSTGQMLFMAVNANSRANMFRNDAQQFHEELQQTKQQLGVIMNLTKMKMDEEEKLAKMTKSPMKVVKEDEPTSTVDEESSGKNIVED